MGVGVPFGVVPALSTLVFLDPDRGVTLGRYEDVEDTVEWSWESPPPMGVTLASTRAPRRGKGVLAADGAATLGVRGVLPDGFAVALSVGTSGLLAEFLSWMGIVALPPFV